MAAARKMHWTSFSETSLNDRLLAIALTIMGFMTLISSGVFLLQRNLGSSAFALLIGAAMVYFGLRWATRRSPSYPIAQVYQAWGEWALSKGMTFVDSPQEFTLPTSRMPIGTASRPITHAAQGTIGGATVSTMLIGFTTTNVKGDDPPFIQTVLAAHTKSKYPPVTIVPQRGHHEVAAAMGKDVLVESHAFNKKYRVIAKDVETAHAVLQPRVIERLLASDLPTAIAWDGNSIILTQKGLMGDSANLDAHLELLGDLAELVLGFHQVEPRGAAQLRRKAEIRPARFKGEIALGLATAGLLVPGVFLALNGAWRIGLWFVVPGLVLSVIYNVKWSRRYRAAKEATERAYYTENLD